MPTALDEWLDENGDVMAAEVSRIDGISNAQATALGGIFDKWIRLAWAEAVTVTRTDLHEKVREYIALGEQIRLIAARK
jgi:hypothetical protein